MVEKVDTVLLLRQVELFDMFDLYPSSVFPLDLVERRPERKEGADGEQAENDEYDNDFRALGECREPYPQPLVLPLCPLVQTFD